MRKIAIVHDWLVIYAGAEKVLEEILKIYPEADLFSLVDFIPDGKRNFLQNKKVQTSFIQNLPLSKKKYRTYLPLMPLAVEQFNLSSYDLVISSSHAIAKGVITGPDQLHISYVHSPIRYAWDLQHQYLRESNLDSGIKGWIAKYFLHRIRTWDVGSANRVDDFIANSNFIRRRIEKIYRRESVVIHPPVSLNNFSLCSEKDDIYLTASRMVPYKKIDLIIQAFRLMPEKKLQVIGDGPDFKKLKALAKGYKNIELLGYQPFSKLKERMEKSCAFLFAAEEDFGITPVEAMACGTPVIAFGKGGVLDTVIHKKTGILFEKQTIESLINAISEFENNFFNYEEIRAHASAFSNNEFHCRFKNHIEKKYNDFFKK